MSEARWEGVESQAASAQSAYARFLATLVRLGIALRSSMHSAKGLVEPHGGQLQTVFGAAVPGASAGGGTESFELALVADVRCCWPSLGG